MQPPHCNGKNRGVRSNLRSGVEQRSFAHTVLASRSVTCQDDSDETSCIACNRRGFEDTGKDRSEQGAASSSQGTEQARAVKTGPLVDGAGKKEENCPEILVGFSDQTRANVLASRHQHGDHRRCLTLHVQDAGADVRRERPSAR